MPRKIFNGVVSKVSNANTLSVVVNSMVRHKVYKKIVTVSKKYSVHYFGSDIKAGDSITFSECKPISKSKKWVILN